jgi:leucyl/phenylalanyl-tRNA--protein transferase
MKQPAGIDPNYPCLDETERCQFPDPARARGSIIAWGGNLSPGILLSAYEHGIFPWYNEDQPILWQSPPERAVLYPQDLHIAKSMQKILRQHIFTIRYNSAFAAVIQNCAATPRRGQAGTWITADMQHAYRRLHTLGYAHSAEAWKDGKLCGGCYGILLPRRPLLPPGHPSEPRPPAIFFGESMYSHTPNASKAAFITLAKDLFAGGIRLIDCQVQNPHLSSLGTREISRTRFLTELHNILG